MVTLSTLLTLSLGGEKWRRSQVPGGMTTRIRQLGEDAKRALGGGLGRNGGIDVEGQTRATNNFHRQHYCYV